VIIILVLGVLIKKTIRVSYTHIYIYSRDEGHTDNFSIGGTKMDETVGIREIKGNSLN
jgi:hypothetical protein